jgi:hypothetical protein
MTVASIGRGSSGCRRENASRRGFPVGRPLQRDRDAAPVGELDRVVEQVQQDLLHPPLVAEQNAGGGQRTHRQLQALARRHRSDRGYDALDRGDEIKGPEAKFKLPRLDLREVEHLVDEGEQMPGAHADHAELLGLFRAQRPGEPLQDDPGEADDRVERRAQLVRHGREESRFGPVARLGTTECGLELRGAFDDTLLELLGMVFELLMEQANLLGCLPAFGDIGSDAEDFCDLALRVARYSVGPGNPDTHPVATDVLIDAQLERLGIGADLLHELSQRASTALGRRYDRVHDMASDQFFSCIAKKILSKSIDK